MLKSPLAKTYFLATLVIGVALSVLFTVIDFARLYEGAKQELQQTHDDLLHSYQEPVSWALWVIDSQQLKAQLKGLVAVSGVNYASVKSEDLELLLEAGERGERAQQQKDTTVPIRRLQDGEWVYLGRLTVSGSLASVYHSTLDLAISRLLINVLQTIPAVLFSFYIFQVLVVKRLEKACRYIGTDGVLQNLGAPLTLGLHPFSSRKDELDQFADALNSLRIEAASLNGMFDAAPEGIVTLDKAGCLLRVNCAALRLFNVSWAQIHSVSIDSLVEVVQASSRSLDIPSLQALLHQSVSQGQIEPRELEVRLAHTDEHQWWQLSGATLFEPEQQQVVSGWILIFRDISKEKQLEDMVRRGEKFKTVGQLASGVAHDFNNSLAGIVSAAELLSDHPVVASDRRLTKYLSVINQSSARASELIEKLLAFSRGNKTEHKPLSLQELCQDVMDIMLTTLPSTVSITFSDYSEQSVVAGHRAELQHSLINLCLNASKAMPEGGEIRLSLKNCLAKPGGCQSVPDGVFTPKSLLAQIVVTDTGSGIEPESLSKIFDPFYTTRAGKGGTGLGLATVFNTMNDHRGYISVQSSMGQGSTFVLWLPVSDCAVSAGLPTPKPVVLKAGRVLLAEDDPVVRLSTTEQLEKLGLSVHATENGEQALEYFTHHHAQLDLLVIDFDMPKLNALELLLSLRQFAPHFPVIVYSGYLDTLMAESLEQAKVSACLKKPLHSSELAQAIVQVEPALERNKRVLTRDS